MTNTNNTETTLEAPPEQLLFAPELTIRESTVILHQQLTDSLKEHKAMPIGLDSVREFLVFDTLQKLIADAEHDIMPESAKILRRIESQLKHFASTWQLLTNQSTMYGNQKSKLHQTEIHDLQNKIIALKKKKKTLIFEQTNLQIKYDDISVSTKTEFANLVQKCNTMSQQLQDSITHQKQILEEYKGKARKHQQQQQKKKAQFILTDKEAK